MGETLMFVLGVCRLGKPLVIIGEQVVSALGYARLPD